MSAIEILLIVVGVSLALLYVLGCLVLSRTCDTGTLHRYAGRYPFSWIARKRLSEIYAIQLEWCSTAKGAEEICNATERLTFSLDLYNRACQKWEKLAVEEMTRELENARGNEGKLLALLGEIAHHLLLPVRELEAQVLVALRPFTEKRIRGATTIRELVDLNVGQGASMIKQSANMFSFGYEISRIDDSLKELYLETLIQFILKEVIRASTFEDTKCFYFKIPTGATVLDELISLKKSLLAPSVMARPNLAKSLDDVNFELRLFLK